jgi:hypothetical protein
LKHHDRFLKQDDMRGEKKHLTVFAGQSLHGVMTRSGFQVESDMEKQKGEADEEINDICTGCRHDRRCFYGG